VRKFSSSDKPDQTQEEMAKQLIPLYWMRMPQTLSPEEGMHRWVWDLHYPAPLSTRHEYPISAVLHATHAIRLVRAPCRVSTLCG